MSVLSNPSGASNRPGFLLPEPIAVVDPRAPSRRRGGGGGVELEGRIQYSSRRAGYSTRAAAMASTVLEQTRALHEDIEILEKTMYGELGDASATKLKRADEVARDQVVSTVLGAHTSKCAELTAIYEDADGARRDEVNAMSGTGVFTAFYDQLKGIREYHRKFPREPAMESYESELLGALLTRDDPTLAFSGEEAEGKYVDMHGCHEMYLNLKGADHLDYAAYLQRCSELAAIDKSVASTTQYRSYVNAMCAYFIDYLKRTQPLMPLAELLAKAERGGHRRKGAWLMPLT